MRPINKIHIKLFDEVTNQVIEQRTYYALDFVGSRSSRFASLNLTDDKGNFSESGAKDFIAEFFKFTQEKTQRPVRAVRTGPCSCNIIIEPTPATDDTQVTECPPASLPS